MTIDEAPSLQHLGGSVGGLDWNPLLRAVFLGRLRLTRLLLEGGAYVNESDGLGRTPLMVAVLTPHRDAQSAPRHRMVRYLLECGADPNIQDKFGRTALVHAVLAGVEPQIVALLVGSGGDPALPDHDGGSALVHAVRSGHRHTLRLLVDACRATGKEVIIITSDLPPGNKVRCPPCVSDALPVCQIFSFLCKMAPSLSSDLWLDQYRSPPQGASTSPNPQPGSPLLEAHGTAAHFPEAPPLQRRLCTEDDTKRRPFCRRHSMDVRDGVLSPLQSSGHAHRRRALGRKMSYDSATSSPHSASHPDLHQEAGTSSTAGSGKARHVIQLRRSDHYSSDSQLQFGRESRAPFERRSSGALLSDHIAHTRPGYLPPLNPHVPIPHIGVSAGVCSGVTGVNSAVSSAVTKVSSEVTEVDFGVTEVSSGVTGVSSEVSTSLSLCATFPLSCRRRSSLTSSKSAFLSAPSFPKDLNLKKTLWRRHSMQSDQIKELSL
uniref:Uncharacterized protein n=1 Tax=Periophthalmus magnuspinnatus TaxID=409849 RepID=A0A3B4BCZ5_9GOBI